jgi:hypothetical protein
MSHQESMNSRPRRGAVVVATGQELELGMARRSCELFGVVTRNEPVVGAVQDESWTNIFSDEWERFEGVENGELWNPEGVSKAANASNGGFEH